MTDVISEYQKWKQQGDELRLKAKQVMEARFREVLAEAARIAEEYRADFGAVLKPSAPVTAFRYKAGAKNKKKKAAEPKAAVKVETKPVKADPKVAGLLKRLATSKRKLEVAKAANKPTRLFEDKVYEIEDALRLAGHVPQ